MVKVRTILDKLVYNDFYDVIDSSMSCSNIGARRNRNIRDHLFVVNSIFNDIKQNKNIHGIDCQIYDISKCFDKMWYAETANDLYKAGLTNDKFILVANSNKEAQVAVKTPWGSLTNRVKIQEIEMQGTVLSNIKCSVQIDSLGQDCITENKGIFKYKGCISIPPLSMVDDVITISNLLNAVHLLNAVQVQQLAAARAVCGFGCWRWSRRKLLEKMGWLSVRQLVFYHSVLQVHKTLKTRVPLSLFQALSVDFPRRTRSAANGQIRQDDSFLSQATFKYRAMKSYNSVPDSVRTGSTVTVKRRLKQWIKTNILID